MDSTLYGRSLEESKQMLLRVRDDIRTARLTASHRSSTRTASHDGSAFTRLEAIRTFLPESLMENLAAVANRGLRLRRQLPTSAHEMLGIIILHVLCASYDESPRTVCDLAESEHFFQIEITSERYMQV